MNIKNNKLLIVYKERDAIAVDMLRKLVENSGLDIQFMTQLEKVWIDNIGHNGLLYDHVLFINNIKGTKGVGTIATTRFKESGICIKYDGTRGVISTDSSALSDARNYYKFLNEFVVLKESDNEKLLSGETLNRTKRNASHKYFSKVVLGKTKIRNQQLVYGAKVFFDNYLMDFLKEN